VSGPLRNDLPVWLAGVQGPGHRAELRGYGVLPKMTVCGQSLAGMIRTTLAGCAVNGIPFCDRCWPEAGSVPGWPLSRRGRS